MERYAPYPVRALRAALLSTLVAAVIAAAVLPAHAAGDTGPPEEVAVSLARDFLSAFAAKDLDRVASMFAPTAHVQRARVATEPPELAQFATATDWLAEAGRGIQSVRDFEIEVLETSALAFDGGVNVAVRFRATGSVGEGVRFVNDGVDTFSMARADGAWRIVLYNSFEKLRVVGAQ